MPARFLERVPYCVESYKFLREMEQEKRLQIQKYMLDETDHSVMGSIYMGVMRSQRNGLASRRADQMFENRFETRANHGYMDDINGAEMTRILKELPYPTNPSTSRSALTTSLYF